MGYGYVYKNYCHLWELIPIITNNQFYYFLLFVLFWVEIMIMGFFNQLLKDIQEKNFGYFCGLWLLCTNCDYMWKNKFVL